MSPTTKLLLLLVVAAAIRRLAPRRPARSRSHHIRDVCAGGSTEGGGRPEIYLVRFGQMMSPSALFTTKHLEQLQLDLSAQELDDAADGSRAAPDHILGYFRNLRRRLNLWRFHDRSQRSDEDVSSSSDGRLVHMFSTDVSWLTRFRFLWLLNMIRVN
ncbi:hypothetical protein BRADI_4g16191v3 [Brachypodium distachyon]|uniref:Uncharacterized protein n=1 Tax=Brachypodium distachyon TaxID=15368 RepID=A0A0Q3PFN3_BRADI|nr:hypothetical protein BRADI_4g16191v3 [Brachypodium distachyon]